KNLDAVTTEDRAYGAGWAVAAWFVPLVNLFLPYQIATEIWAGSAMGSRGESGSGGGSGAVAAWWGLWVASALMGLTAHCVLRLNFLATTVADLRLANRFGALSEVLEVAAGLYAVALVQAITRRQAARFHSLKR